MGIYERKGDSTFFFLMHYVYIDIIKNILSNCQNPRFVQAGFQRWSALYSDLRKPI